jgi:hypothetical protein
LQEHVLSAESGGERHRARPLRLKEHELPPAFFAAAIRGGGIAGVA